MNPKDLTLHLDVKNRRLVRDFFSNLEITLPDLIQGDSYNLRLIGVEANPLGNPSRPWRYVSLPTTAYAGIGTPGQRPASGTFTLSWGGDTTAAIAYNASAATVQTALNALASITTAGGVTVSASADGGPYQVTWNTAGSRAAITGEPAALYPLSVITVYTDREGTVSLREIQILSLDRSPAALAETFTALASPGGSVSTLQAGASGTPEIQRIALDESTHDGTFTLTFSGQTTAALSWDITAADLKTALEALSNIAVGDVAITGAFPQWDVTFQGALTGNQPQMTISTAGLIGPQGIEGTLSLATGGIEALLDGDAQVETEIEIAFSISGTPVTLYQGSVTVQNDLIPNAPAVTTSGPTYYTASEVDAGFVPQGSTVIADDAGGASTSHALNSTFSDTEVEAALDALGTRINALSTKLNTLLGELRTLNVLGT